LPYIFQDMVAVRTAEKGKERMDDKKRLRIVIAQMIRHNDEHAQDFTTWGNFAEVNGAGGVSSMLDEARKHIDAATAALRSALDSLD